jgi:hypothetical protein
MASPLGVTADWTLGTGYPLPPVIVAGEPPESCLLLAVGPAGGFFPGAAACEGLFRSLSGGSCGFFLVVAALLVADTAGQLVEVVARVLGGGFQTLGLFLPEVLEPVGVVAVASLAGR